MSHWDGQITLDPNAWTIGPIINGQNFSIGMPIHPWSPWTFQFPQAPGEVHYVTADAPASLDFQWVQIEFTIDNGDGPFWAVDEPGQPGLLRLILQHAGDNWQAPDGRFWSQPLTLDDGHYIMTVPLDPSQWTNVFGQVSPGGFGAVLASGGNVGFTFGHSFAGHGVYSEDAAQFHLLDYDFLNDPTTVLTEGDDNINFFIYDDVVVAGGGNDNLHLGRGNDSVSGGFGNDSLQGNQGNDTLQGNQEDDFIWGGQGHDEIYGGQGNDNIWGNLGNDTIHGNLGTDTYHLPGNRGDYGFWFGDGGVYIWGIDTGPQAAQGLDLVFSTTDFVLFEQSGQTVAFQDLV